MAKRLKRNNPEILLYGEAGLPHLSQDEPPDTFVLNELTGVLYIRRQDMSLVAVSCSPAYGGLLIHEANTGQVIATGAPQKLTVWATAFPEAGGVDGQVVNDRIVIVSGGVYLTAWHMSFITSGPARWVGHVYLNGASCCLDWDRNVSGPGGPGGRSRRGIRPARARTPVRRSERSVVEASCRCSAVVFRPSREEDGPCNGR